jgi:hypothetical protein
VTTPLSPTNDPGLLPAAAAARPMQAGMESVARALDGQALEGRRAVRRVRRTKAGAETRGQPPDGRGRRLDRTA